MSKNVTNNNTGVGFLGLLQVLFIGLKLTEVITWSWWWVLAPLWAPFALVLLILIIAIAFDRR